LNSITVIVLSVAIFLNALANILIKASALKKDEMSVNGLVKGFILNPWMIAGIMSFGIALIAYRYVLNQGIKVSLAYPLMTTTGYALVLLASRFFFNEHLNSVQWIGIGFLVVGIWLISSQFQNQ
jgi:multidrug transporter EmrE-like cation transporter